jgi:hypothetical protein
MMVLDVNINLREVQPIMGQNVPSILNARPKLVTRFFIFPPSLSPLARQNRAPSQKMAILEGQD